MPDYVAIIKRSVDALSENTQTARATVYERARAALNRQLSAVKPELSQSAIDSQRRSLEEAITGVEAEQRSGSVQPAAPSAPDAPGAPAATPPVEAPAAVAPVQPAPAAPPPAQAVRPTPPVSPAPAAPVSAPPPTSYVQPTSHVQASQSHNPATSQAGHVASAAQAIAPAPPHAPQTPVAGTQGDSNAHVDGAPERQRYFGAGPQGASGNTPNEKPAKASRSPFLIVLVLIALVGLGLAAIAYTQWPMIAGLIGGSATEEQAATTETPAAESTTEPVDQTAQPAQQEAQQETPSDVRVVTPEDPNQGSQQAELQRPVGADEAPVAEAPAADTSTSAPADQSGDVLVGQRAIFYEQGDGDEAGSAIEGGVSWQPVPQPDGLDAIQATIDLPSRQSKAVITIKKNTDDGLPASHLIEISFENVEVLSNGLIDRIPALVLKPSEQERGQPLVGAAVPVTESLFWIALSDEGDQVSRNIELMREGSWFDLPILFDGGQRALLTFEKGVSGDQVFETVMSKWAQ